MGRDKASLPFGAETLLSRMVRIVGEVAHPIVVVAAPNQRLPPLPGRVLVARDPVADRGPLQGLAVGLAALASEVDYAFVVPTDAPLLAPAFIRRMASLSEGHDAAVPLIDSRHEVLAAVYATRLHPLANDLLRRRQQRLVALLDQVRVRVVDEASLLADPGLRATDPRLDSLRNLNTWDEYQAALTQADTDAR